MDKPTCPIAREYNPLAAEQVQNPFEMYARARKECPVFFSPMYQMWFVTRHEDVCEVLRDTETFSSVGIISVHSQRTPPEVARVLESEGLPQVPAMTDNDPPGHDRVRTMVGNAFNQKIVAAMESHIRGIADEMFGQYKQEGRFEVLEKFAFPFPLVVIGDILGVERQHLPNLKQWCDDWVALLSSSMELEQQLEAAHGFCAFQRFFHDLIEEKRLHPRQDLISHMINARLEGAEPLTTLEMVNTCMSATWAGHQTATSMIVSMLFHLLVEPGRWASLRADRSLVPRAVEETLRLDSPLLGMLRFTRRPARLGGAEIPIGQPVQVLFASANHDETVFPTPERFDLHRQGAPHLGFGRGVHYCLGSQLARLEGKVAVEVLMDRAPNLRLVPGQKLEYLPNFIYRTLKGLELEWDMVAA
jgi:cytochrome P450